MENNTERTRWYKDWFGPDYLKVYPHRNEEEARQQVAFVESVLNLQKTQRILDLGCGSGRHAIELSERGYHVTCLDLSSTLLSLARQRSEHTCCVRFVRADMRRMPFHHAFEVVVSFFTTFGYFDSDAENLRTLKSLAAVLKPGGVFLQDYLNKAFVVNNLVAHDVRKEDGYEIAQNRRYNREQERIEKEITITENGETRKYFESVRLYTLDEMRDLLAQAHLKLEQTFGDFAGSRFTPESPRLILVGRKEKL